MRRLMALAAGCAALALPMTALAQDNPSAHWHYMGVSEEGAWAYTLDGAPANGVLVATYYLDIETDSGVSTRGAVMGLEIDCAGNRARNVSQVWYDENLAPLSNVGGDPTDWQSLEPDQYAIDALMAHICAGTPDAGQGDLTGDGVAAEIWLKGLFDQNPQ